MKPILQVLLSSKLGSDSRSRLSIDIIRDIDGAKRHTRTYESLSNLDTTDIGATLGLQACRHQSERMSRRRRLDLECSREITEIQDAGRLSVGGLARDSQGRQQLLRMPRPPLGALPIPGLVSICGA